MKRRNSASPCCGTAAGPGAEIAPEHRETAGDIGRLQHAEDTGGHEIGKGTAHVILAEPVPPPPGMDARLAGAHGAQMLEIEVRVIPADGDPAHLTGLVAIDGVPHDLADKTTNRLKTGYAVEFRHARRHLIAAPFRHELAVHAHVGLARTGADARVLPHPVDQRLEIPRRQVQIEIKLAEIIEVIQLYCVQTGIKRLDDAGPHRAVAAIGFPDHADPVMPGHVLGQDLGGLVGGTVVDDHPERGPHRLGPTLSSVRRIYAPRSGRAR
jgi:hypothetical protein